MRYTFRMVTSRKKQNAAAKKQLEKIQKGRRATQFVTQTIFQILFVALLCAIAFMYCTRLASSYLLAHEGMASRAAYILGDADINDVSLYFSEDCIAADTILTSGTYSNYTITQYGYSLQITKIHVAPWFAQPYVEVIEQVKNIKGDANTEDASSTPPEWTTLRYRLDFDFVRGRWIITGLRVAEIAPELPSPATPDPNMDPIPMVTATPKPTEEAEPTPDVG